MAIGGVGGMSGTRNFDPTKIAARMVRELDGNGDGVLSKGEFTAGLTARGVSAADAAKRFESIDIKGTGTITQGEIAADIKASAGQAPRPGGGPRGSGRPPGGAPRGGGSAGSSATSSYDPADTNQDGTVSPVESVVYSFKHPAAGITKAGNAVQETPGSILDLTA